MSMTQRDYYEALRANDRARSRDRAAFAMGALDLFGMGVIAFGIVFALVAFFGVWGLVALVGFVFLLTVAIFVMDALLYRSAMKERSNGNR